MLALWLPLAASIVMMVLEPSIVNIGLARTAMPELALAAYGIAYSLALLVEAPVLMILDASVARSADRSAFLLVRRFTVVLGLAVTGVGLVLSLTPLYGLVVEGLMNIPPDMADRARPTLVILSLWPLPVAWRRAYQGVLIRSGRTAVISAATAVRLITLAAVMAAGLVLWPDRGAVVAGVAMVISVTVEAIVTTWAAQPVLRSDRYGAGLPIDGSEPLTLHSLWQFYRPLFATTLLRQASRPLVNAGIASAAHARVSLAAWPVAWGLAILIAGPAWSLQQLTTALAGGPIAYRRVSRFSLAVSAALTALMALVAFTPLYGALMGGLYNLSPALQSVARPAVQILVLFPLLSGIQSVYRGALIRCGQTRAVRTAMLINLVVLLACLVAGVVLGPVPGAALAAGATMVSTLIETAWLGRERLCWAGAAA